MLDNGTHFVLIADDLPEVIEAWTKELAAYDITVVTASTLEELDKVFEEHEQQLDAIILDGCIPGHDVNTLRFIWRVRDKGCQVPIVASSSLREYRDMMIQAGASHQAPKQEAVDTVADLLSAP